MIDRDEVKWLVDVRTDEERKTALIAGGKQLNAELSATLDALDKNTPLVFHCHHGMRSRNAAQRFADEGFRNVYNLEGGIDAWSQEIDSSVARY
jgi:monothiol glutaredoxin